MKEKLIKKIEDIVDNTDTKVIDKFFLAMIMVLILSTAYLFISSLEIFNSGIIPVHSKFLYAFKILSTVSLFSNGYCSLISTLLSSQRKM